MVMRLTLPSVASKVTKASSILRSVKRVLNTSPFQGSSAPVMLGDLSNRMVNPPFTSAMVMVPYQGSR